MRTTKIFVIGNWSLVIGIILLLLAGTVQAVDYKNSYRSEYRVQSTEYRAPGIATSPSVSFQSTSAYSGQWNRDAQQSTLNSDGTVNGEAYMSALPGSSIRRGGGGSGYNPGTPDDEEEEEGEQQPIGDGLWVLILLALAYLSMRALLKKRALNR